MLDEKQRESLEDCIMDLHYTTSKYLESEKDVHKKLLEVNIQEAIHLLTSLKDFIKDDHKIYDYKMHLMFPLQVYELLKLREEREEDNNSD